MTQAMLHGVWSAVITPLDAALQPDASKAVAYYRELLAEGCHGLNVLGTSGEAMSLSAGQRIRFMEALVAGGLPRERMMAGTGAASLEDAVALTSAASACGFAAALVMPPFFYRDAGDDGVVAFFAALLERLHEHRPRIILYNFPAMSGARFHPALVDRLIAELPGVIGGMKDSSGDPALQREIVKRHPDLAIFTSSEGALLDALAYGAAGCISGSVALWPQLAREVYEKRDPAAALRLAKLRDAIAAPNLIARVRYLTARARNDAAWRRPLPPLLELSEEEADRLSPFV